LDAGADVEARTNALRSFNGGYIWEANTSLHVASSFGFVDVVQCLLENGADIDAEFK